MNAWNKLIAWLKFMLKRYDTEIQAFAADLIELAFNNLTKAEQEKLQPALINKIKNEVIVAVIMNKVDIATIEGKSKVSNFVMAAIKKYSEP